MVNLGLYDAQNAAQQIFTGWRRSVDPGGLESRVEAI